MTLHGGADRQPVMENRKSRILFLRNCSCRSPFKIRAMLVFLAFGICFIIIHYQGTHKPVTSVTSRYTFPIIFTGRNVSSSKLELTSSVICPNGTLISMPGLCYLQQSRNATTHLNLRTNSTSQMGHPYCIMSINHIGRLGNNLGQYATLMALAKWNRRPAFMLPSMAKKLRAYFDVSMPVLSEEADQCLSEKWTNLELQDRMVDDYRSLDIAPEQPVMIKGYLCSWTFFDHIRQEVRKEFRMHTYIVNHAQEVLRSLVDNSRSSTFVGVHVRRTDYVDRMKKEEFRGVLANAEFFKQAMDYYRSQYKDVIFVVASDDMEWCMKNIDNSLGDVRFSGVGVTTDPIHDFALLTQCNHSIITVGTFGFWVGYLTGGEVVYLDNYLMPNSPFRELFRFEEAYLPSWKPISADLSDWVVNRGL